MKIPELPALPMIDSHAHLDFPEIQSQESELFARATAQGVQAVIAMGNDAATSKFALELSQRVTAPRIFPAAGLHPHESKRIDEDRETLEALWQDDRVVCVGEIGLDYYYDLSPKDVQRKVFENELEWAAKVKKPVSIHLRDAFDDGFAILRNADLSGGGVLHCFQGGPKELEIVMDLGLYVSFSGMVTFKNATALREAAPLAPADRYLIETDSPFLAPVPLRGRTNEPSFVAHTANALAALRGVSYEQVLSESYKNTIRLFHLPL